MIGTGKPSKTPIMDATTIQELLYEAISDRMEIRSVQTFPQAGVLSPDPGLVVKDHAGRTFHLTVRQIDTCPEDEESHDRTIIDTRYL
jgi:hypothetical protein